MMPGRPKDDGGVWGSYVAYLASLESQLAEEREKNERLRDALEQIAGYEPATPEIMYDEFAYNRMLQAFKDHARAALASTGSEE